VHVYTNFHKHDRYNIIYSVRIAVYHITCKSTRIFSHPTYNFVLFYAIAVAGLDLSLSHTHIHTHAHAHARTHAHAHAHAHTQTCAHTNIPTNHFALLDARPQVGLDHTQTLSHTRKNIPTYTFHCPLRDTRNGAQSHTRTRTRTRKRIRAHAHIQTKKWLHTFLPFFTRDQVLGFITYTYKHMYTRIHTQYIAAYLLYARERENQVWDSITHKHTHTHTHPHTQTSLYILFFCRPLRATRCGARSHIHTHIHTHIQTLSHCHKPYRPVRQTRCGARSNTHTHTHAHTHALSLTHMHTHKHSQKHSYIPYCLPLHATRCWARPHMRTHTRTISIHAHKNCYIPRVCVCMCEMLGSTTHAHAHTHNFRAHTHKLLHTFLPSFTRDQVWGSISLTCPLSKRMIGKFVTAFIDITTPRDPVDVYIYIYIYEHMFLHINTYTHT